MNDLTQVVKTLAIGQDNVVVEDFGKRYTKVSGRCAHYIRDGVKEDSRLRVKRDINQYAFTVEWNA